MGTLLINRDGERKPLSSSVRSKQNEKKYDYYGATGVIDKVDSYIFSEKLLLVGEDGANLLSKIKPNAFFAEGKYWVNNHAHILDATDKSLLNYVIVVINSISLDNYITGSAQPKLSQEKLNKILLPLPPLSEQRRIVEKIEELLALVDDLETNKTNLQSYIKQAKSKVLEMAIRGELVPQNPNDEPASVLLERIKKEQKSSKSKDKNAAHNTHYEEELPFDIPENWVWCRLGEVCEIIMGQSPKSENISKKGKLEFHQGKIFFTSKYIQSSESYTNEITKIAPKNSVLICVRAPVGEVNITNRELCIGRGLCSIVPLQKMSEIFVYYWTKILKEKFIQKATGSTFASISMDIIRNEIIPLPPLSEQHRIVEKIEEIFSALGFIEENLI